MAKDNTEYSYLDEVPKQKIPGGTKKIGMFYPEELTLIRDRGHYLWDSRVENDFDEDMVKGIMELGLSKSVDVQKIKMDDGTCILAVIDGRQGVINTIEANRRLVEAGLKPMQIKVEVRDEDEIHAMRRMVVNNEHRVSDDPVTKGYKAKALRAKDVPIELVCQDFRCVPETLNYWINLTDLCVHVQKLVQTNKLAMTAALKLRKLSPAEQKVEADKIVAGTKKSNRGVGNQHVGVDKRRIKRIYELSGIKNPVAQKIFQWLVGSSNDEDVADLIDFSVLSKESKSKQSSGRGRKSKENDGEQDELLASIFGKKGSDQDDDLIGDHDEADMDDEVDPDIDDTDIDDGDD